MGFELWVQVNSCSLIGRMSVWNGHLQNLSLKEEDEMIYILGHCTESILGWGQGGRRFGVGVSTGQEAVVSELS